MRQIILCADDYSLSDSITLGIIELVKNKRLTAVSCMTNTNNWNKNANLLLPHINEVDIGLHFDLTSLEISIGKLLVKSFLRTLDKKQIEKLLRQQIENFKQALNKDPDFIDGHLHIQQFPLIRDILHKVYLEMFPHKKTYIRVSGTTWKDALFSTTGFPKTLVIAFAGTFQFKKQLQNLNIPHNKSFVGIYNFTKHKNFRNYFQRFLKRVSTDGLVMCHPALESSDDALSKARYSEFTYFNSDAFVSDCETDNIIISRSNLSN